MRCLFLLTLLFSSGSLSFAQNDFWFRVTDSSHHQAFIDTKGTVRIPYGKYEYILTDTLKHFAFVFNQEIGVVAINKQEEVLFKPLIVDNFQPDIPNNGLFRIVEDEKIGFANLRGEIVIIPCFEAVRPFQDSIAAFCVGCEMEYDAFEYGYWSGGIWGFINYDGDVIVEPQYDDLGLWNNRLVVKKNGVVYSIDGKGNIYKPLPSSAKPWFH